MPARAVLVSGASSKERVKGGDRLEWNWGGGTGDGRILERLERRVQRTINGTKVVRNDSAECLAFVTNRGRSTAARRAN